MKKALATVLAAIMLIGLMAGCGGGNTTPESTAPESAAPESTAPESTAPESTAPEGWKPEQSVEIIVNGGAGGSTDLLARAVESVWSKYCDQPLVVTNKPGGGGVTGEAYVASSEPDGYTLGFNYGGGTDMSMPILQEMEYDPVSMLDPVCLLSVHTVVIAAPADSEFNSMADLVEWQKKTGEPITVSVSTANGTTDLTSQAIKYYSGLDMNIVPHDGGGPAVTDLLSGAYMIGAHHPSEILTYVKSGQLKALGIATEEPDPSMPDVPTLKSQGIDFAAYGSIKGVSVPEGTDKAIVAYYENLFKQICEDADFQDAMAELGQPVMYMNTAEFTEFFTEAQAFYKTMIEDLGLAYYNK
ncbi:MAG: tripartite tricarboxylate transporter substrate-binding protein [Candidatus Heteroscillospira sp.]|jgi:tripartite-type tricarboxylate transporter receptor subunit TctC